MKVGYILRRFPQLSQSFVLNELQALEARGVSTEIFSILGPDETVIHPGAVALLQRSHQMRKVSEHNFGAVLLWALMHHPTGLLRTLAFALRYKDARLWRTFKYALHIARKMQALDIQQLHAHFGQATEVAMLTSMVTRVPFSFTTHAREIYSGRRLFRDKFCRASFVVTVCEYNRNLIAQLVPEECTDHINIIRPFLDLELFIPSPAPIKHGATTEFRLITVARLVEKKGLILLIHAIAELRQQGLAVTSRIVGEGPQYNELQALINKLNLRESVTLLGARTADQVRDLLIDCDCFVLPSIPAKNGDADATPTVLGEAMAVCLPVISTDLNGIPEIIPERAGRLVPHNDINALSSAITKIAALSPKARQNMGAHGRASVLAHWSSEQGANKLIQLFRESTK